MLQRRRVFDLTNTIMNYAFLVFLLVCALYFFSFWINLKSAFMDIVVAVTNIMAWSMTIISVILAVIALIILTADDHFNALRLLWVVVRMLLCIVISVIVDVTSMLISQGITVTL